MDTAARLHHLLSHWVEHNEAHSQTYREWADRARQEGLEAAALHLEAAILKVDAANQSLRAAEAGLEAARRDGGST